MKHLFKFSLLALLALSAVVSSCNKYEEGSNFSLLSAKNRIINEWKSTSYTSVSSIGTYTSDMMNLTIAKDGSYIQDATSFTFSDDAAGKWTLSADKTELLLTDTDGALTTWTILKLKDKELKLSRVETIGNSSITHTIEFGE